MAVSFNVDEIFEIAERIERNGAKFYREAAQKASDKAVQKVFLDLAAMEEGHFQIFQGMRKQLGENDKEQTTFDPDNQAVLYLQTMADEHGIEGKKDDETKLTGRETMKEIFETAIKAERNSIVFYTSLKAMVSASGKSKLDGIIMEEIGHLVVLKIQLAKLS